jgi:hypothetical protein
MTENMLRQYNATALYTGNQVSADQHPTIYAFLEGLNEWQRNKFLVAELNESDYFDVAMYLFTSTYRYEFLIRDNSVLTSSHSRKPRAGETWTRRMNFREGELSVGHLNTALKVMMTNEAETISPKIFEKPK